ncbi:hypothetical protein P12x_005383 [Tundrisphaera lichenicola]|uniref:hypothetical protein n=1 Tax=Tundrisphaera lichenicola TaxID=2029860 RepID=UPI003EBBCA3D
MDETFAGRQVRCKQCQYRFAIPVPGEFAPDGYALEEPEAQPDRAEAIAVARPDSGSVYAPTRRDQPAAKPRKRPASAPSKKRERPEGPDIAWGAWLIRIGVVGSVALALIAMFAPRGMMIVGGTLLIVGSLMILAGYFAGAYGAFSEDFLYGFLYLVIPFYAGYYLVTRWDDLWRWFACATGGIVLISAGGAILRAAGLDV